MASDHRVVFILGAGPGLGAALAQTFGRAGFTVGLLARNASRLEQLADDLGREGIRCVPVTGDLGDASDLRRALAQLETEAGVPDVVVANASVGVPGPPSTAEPAEVSAGLQIGAVGALVAWQTVLPAMRAAGRGRLLVTGSGVGVQPWVDAVGLSMQKAALRSFALAAASEVAAGPIHASLVTINGVIGAPGLEPPVIAASFLDLATAPDPPAEFVLPIA